MPGKIQDMSKFSLDVLKKCVHPFIKITDQDVILGPVFGEDVALTRIHDGILVSHVDPIVGAVKDIGWLAVHVACNDIATSGARPRWILLLVLVPSMKNEDDLKQIMHDAGVAASEIGVSIIGGHSGYSANLSRPLVAVTALGMITDGKPVCTKGTKIGDHVFITKGIALEGTAILANDFAGIAKRQGLTDQDIEQAKGLMKGVSIIPEALILAESGASSMHDVTRGGLLETLLEIAELSGVGMKVDAGRIPEVPVVARFARAFQFDPFRMISSGTLAATVSPEKVVAVREQLEAANICFSDIGEVVEGKGVQIMHDSKVTVYDEIHCEDDELARMWEMYSHEVSPAK